MDKKWKIWIERDGKVKTGEYMFPAEAAVEDIQQGIRNMFKSRCAYCGTELAKDSQVVADHILTCDKRPEKKLLEKAFEVEQGLIGHITHLTEHPYDPETCDTCQVIRETLETYNSDKEA